MTAGTPGASADFDVTVEISQPTGAGNFLTPTEPYTETETISATTDKGTLRIPTLADTDDEIDGTISVAVQTDPNMTDATKAVNYEASATAAMISIADNDVAGATTAVTVSGPTRVYEGQSADFTFTANPAPTGADVVAVNYRITEVGSFLMTSANTPISAQLMIDADDQNGEVVLSLPTTPDAEDETNGSVIVQVLAYTSGGTVEYNVGSGTDFAAEAELVDDDVNDNSLPSVTIAAETTPISESIESRNATFRLSATSTTPPGSPTVTVSVMISQEGDFLASLAPADINRRVSSAQRWL